MRVERLWPDLRVEELLVATKQHAVFSDDRREGLTERAQATVKSWVAENHSRRILGDLLVV